MNSGDMLDRFAEAAEELSSVDDNEMQLLRSAAIELHEVSSKVNEYEAALKDLKERQNRLQGVIIPDIMREIGVDVIGVPGTGVNIELSTYYKASIPVSWDAERKQRAFNHLEELGAADLVTVNMTVMAGRGQYDEMRQLTQRVQQLMAEYNIQGDVDLSPSVRWNTLTAFVKKAIKNGEPIDLEVLGATVGDRVEIVNKKDN